MKNSFTTSNGVRIPYKTMLTLQRRIEQGDDWQKIMTEELRGWIPESEFDLDEAYEILNEAQDRIHENAESR